MRVVAGRYKGLHLVAAKYTRPTTQLVKSAIFNILNNQINFSTAQVLDLYAGSGALGIESISRGANLVTFVENNFSACKVIKLNLSNLDKSLYKVITANVKTFLTKDMRENTNKFNQYNLVFMDPPYFTDFTRLKQELELLASSGCLVSESIVIVEQHQRENRLTSDKFFEVELEKRYGDTRISFLTKCL